jgi:Methyltransferase domain
MESHDEVVTGTLVCGECGLTYPIEERIPILLPPTLRELVRARQANASPAEFTDYRTEATPAVARLVGRLARSASIVLDLGSGRGPYLPQLSGDVICVDMFSEFLRDLPGSIDDRVRVHPICASATDLPVRPAVADLVLASELIEHLDPASARRALDEWPRLAKQWCVIDTPNGREGDWLTRLRHLVYRTSRLTHAEHPDLPELDHHSMFAPDDFRAAGYRCHGCIGWVSRKRFRLGPLWDLYDVIAWRLPAIGGTLVAVTPGRAA